MMMMGDIDVGLFVMTVCEFETYRRQRSETT